MFGSRHPSTATSPGSFLLFPSSENDQNSSSPPSSDERNNGGPGCTNIRHRLDAQSKWVFCSREIAKNRRSLPSKFELGPENVHGTPAEILEYNFVVKDIYHANIAT